MPWLREAWEFLESLVNLQFDPKELIWSNLSLLIGLPVTCLPTLRSAKIRISEGDSGISFKNILAVLIGNIRLQRSRI